MKPAERIQVNGHWYILEDSDTYEFNITEAESIALETDTSCFEMSVLKGGLYPSIQYTDKRVDRPDWEEETWDGEVWMRGVLEGDEHSLKQLEDLTKEDAEAVKYLLSKAQEKEWI